MVTLRIVVLILHITAAMLWVGPTLGLVKSTRRALPISREALGAAIADYKLRGGLAAIGGIGMILTGIALIFIAGGFKAVAFPIHIALTLGIIAAVHSMVFGKGGKVLEETYRSYDAASIGNADRMLAKLMRHSHFTHFLWLTILTLMFVAQVVPRA